MFSSQKGAQAYCLRSLSASYFSRVETGRPPCLSPFGRVRLGGLLFFGFAG